MYSCVHFRSELCCITLPFQPCCGLVWQPGTFMNRWPRSLHRTRTGIHLCPLSSRYWSKHRFSNVFLWFNFVVNIVWKCSSSTSRAYSSFGRHPQYLTAPKSFCRQGLRGGARLKCTYQILICWRSSGFRLPAYDPCPPCLWSFVAVCIHIFPIF